MSLVNENTQNRHDNENTSYFLLVLCAKVLHTLSTQMLQGTNVKITEGKHEVFV
jgi:hypothetical protein